MRVCGCWMGAGVRVYGGGLVECRCWMGARVRVCGFSIYRITYGVRQSVRACVLAQISVTTQHCSHAPVRWFVRGWETLAGIIDTMEIEKVEQIFCLFASIDRENFFVLPQERETNLVVQ